jgi:hypothetical protein
LSVASTTYQSRRTSSGLAEKVFIDVLSKYAALGAQANLVQLRLNTNTVDRFV